MQTLVDSEPCNFILSFHFDENEKLLGFIFQSDLEMLCRANEISLAHNLMEILERVYQNEPLSFPVVVFLNVQQLQVA